MAPKKGGLGRGLDALLVDNSIENTSSSSAVKLKLNDIEPNKNQPRKILTTRHLQSFLQALKNTVLFSPFL